MGAAAPGVCPTSRPGSLRAGAARPGPDLLFVDFTCLCCSSSCPSVCSKPFSAPGASPLECRVGSTASLFVKGAEVAGRCPRGICRCGCNWLAHFFCISNSFFVLVCRHFCKSECGIRSTVDLPFSTLPSIKDRLWKSMVRLMMMLLRRLPRLAEVLSTRTVIQGMSVPRSRAARSTRRLTTVSSALDTLLLSRFEP